MTGFCQNLFRPRPDQAGIPLRDCALAMILVLAGLFSTGCSTLASLGLPFGDSDNQILQSAKHISERPGQSLLLPKELARQPLDIYLLDIGDTVLVEAVKFDATIRLPGDQLIKPDGHITLGEFGRYLAAGKTLEQVQLEIQAIIDQQIRFDIESSFESSEATTAETDKLNNNLDQQSATTTPTNTNPTFSPVSEHEEQNSDRPFVRAVALPEQPAAKQDDDQDLDQDGEASERELQNKIDEALAQNRISVRLINWDSQKIYVLGEVNSPGSFAFIGNETVLDGIIEAGGLTNRANQHQIIVARPTTCDSCRIVMQVCYDQIVQLGDTATNYQLRPGDRIFVPSLTFRDDLKNTFSFGRTDRCPRCSNCPQGCELAEGCQ